MLPAWKKIIAGGERERGQEEDAIAVFYYWREGYRQDKANPHHQCTVKWQVGPWPSSQGKFHLDASKMHFPGTMIKPWHREALTSHPWEFFRAVPNKRWPTWSGLVHLALGWVGQDIFRDLDFKLASSNTHQLPTPGTNSDRGINAFEASLTHHKTKNISVRAQCSAFCSSPVLHFKKRTFSINKLSI